MRRAAVLLVVGMVLAGEACEQDAPGQQPPRHISPSVLDHLSLGRTPAADIERLLGTPDERAPDGSLIYRSYRSPLVRSPGGSETFTFRFQDGVLTKVCRTRT